MTFIFISTCVVLLFIGAIIIYLHLKENKHDETFAIGNINLL